MEQIIENFKRMFADRTDLFVESTQEQIDKLKKLFGDNVYKITEFYSKFQPAELPMVAYASLCDIEGIIEENSDLAPGAYLAEYGVYVFASTVGGNGICIDTNDAKDGDTSVLIADHCFCSYNEFYDAVEITSAPKEVMDKYINEWKKNPDCDILRLNYPNIKKCLPKIEDSFFEFMRKLSLGEYEDIEKFLP